MQTAEKHTYAFQTEVKQLLQLMIHSLYSDKEIFLRELISNGSDALDKLRFNALQVPAFKGKDSDLKIRVSFDKEAGTITVSDNGIGMNEAEVIDNLGTIAKSGTKAFVEKLTGDQSKDAELIGQFGVGFYSSFMVADKVTVTTRRADEPADAAVIWESKGDGEYTLEHTTKATQGTDIVLHLKKDEDELLSDWRLRSIIVKYSDHIAFPVEMPSEASKEFEAVNKATALWMRQKSEITDEEYKEFYKLVSHDFQDPLAWSHNQVEGKTEYTSLLYIPKHAPFDLYQVQMKNKGVKLYVKRVFIMDDAEQFIPHYLRFVRGVIDAKDLPLNVSREILQNNKIVSTIKAGTTKKILAMLQSMADNEPQDYLQCWAEFGPALKEGIVEDEANKEAIAKLMRFATTFKNEPGQTASLDDYIARMKPEQEAIYYVTAETFAAAKNSPHLEIFRKQGIEVLLLSDRIDEWLTGHLTEYQGKKLISVAKGDLDLGELEPKAAEAEKHAEEIKDLLNAMKTALAEQVKEVRATHRLTDSPACIVADENDMGLHMQRLFKAAGQPFPVSKPILEINPEHPLIARLNQHPTDPVIQEWARLLLDQATLAEGAQLEDPAAYVKRVNSLLMG
jgi:molecular chaperone HtpG